MGEKGIQMTDVMTGTPFTDHIGIKKPKGKRKLKKYRPPESITYCVHEWCYSAFLWKAKGCPSSVMYRLVKTLTFQYSPWQNDYRDRQSRSLWGLYPDAEILPEVPMKCLTTAPAELQPLFLARFPAEIRAVIWYYAQYSAYAGFLRVTGETSPLARQLRKPETVTLEMKDGATLLPMEVSIFDTSYIHTLDVQIPTSELFDLEQKLKGVTSIKFIASQGGICALKPYGEAWEGRWLGEIPAAGPNQLWYGNATNAEGKFKFTYTVSIHFSLANICLTIQDLNLMEIKSAAEMDPETEIEKKQIVWDRPDHPPIDTLSDPGSALFDYDPQRDFDDAASERQPFSHVRMFKYLPFMKGRDYMTGLTIYCGTAGGDDGLRMTGIEAHFGPTSQLSGSREGCAMYFHFSPGEKIAYMWLRSCGDPWSGYLRPSLVVRPLFLFPLQSSHLQIQTTFSCRHHFGPYLSPEWIEEDAFDPYWWIRLENKGHIKGLFYEQPIHNPYFRSIGIIDDPTPLRVPALMPQYHNWPNSRCPRWIGTPDKDLYISTAYLDPLEEITVCKVGERCTGMMIRFSVSRITVLGQWQQECRSQHVCIFSSPTPKNINLWFQMKRYYPRENSTATTISHIVTDIGVSEDGRVEMLSGRDYRAFSPGEVSLLLLTLFSMGECGGGSR